MQGGPGAGGAGGVDAVLLKDVDGDEIEDVAILAAGEVHVRSGETGPAGPA